MHADQVVGRSEALRLLNLPPSVRAGSVRNQSLQPSLALCADVGLADVIAASDEIRARKVCMRWRVRRLAYQIRA